ncbi:MAG: Nif11-like leader peptide family natural product precursor [Terriglobales bacterium]
MSKADVERFVRDARGNEKLQNELKKVLGASAVVEVANKHGSKITEADMRSWLEDQNTELDEKQLESVTGGIAGGSTWEGLRWGLEDKFP